MRAAQRPQRAGGEIVDALAVEDHLTCGDVEQPQDRAADRRLAAAGLADQRQRLALRDVERHAVDGIDRAALRAEQAPWTAKVLLEVVDLEQRRVHAAPASLRRIVAGREVAGAPSLQRRRDLPAQIGRERAAAGEDAAGDALLQARHHARDFGEPVAVPSSEEPSRGTAPSRPCV